MDPVLSSFGFSEIQFVPLEYYYQRSPDTTYVWTLYDYLSWIIAPRIIEYSVGGVYWGESRSYQNLVMSGTSPLLLIVSFFLFPNILQIFSYNGSFQHIQTLLHLRILKIEWVRGWRESLFVKGGGEGTLDSIAVSIFIDWLSWQILYQKPRSK